MGASCKIRSIGRRLAAPLCAAGLLAGCTVLPIEEARALRERSSGAFEVERYVDSIWPARVDRELAERALPVEQLRSGDLEALGSQKGNRAGEGSAWTFVIRGEGVVRAIEQGPRGRLQLDTASGPVSLQLGPVVSGTAIRDALPFIAFDGFPDQIAYSEVGMMLTDRALKRLAPALARVQPGARVTFMGVAGVAEPGAPLLVTPLTLEPVGGSSGAAR